MRERGVTMPEWKAAPAGGRVISSAGEGAAVSAGAELYSLCQTAAADGTLSPRELALLRAWLARSEEVQVPARAYVRELLEHILRTGRVAPADLQALGRVLEPSLPRQVRHPPAALHLVGSDKMPHPDDSAAERVRNEVLASACFMVAGCPSERRASLIQREARAGEPVLLVRPRGDAPSENAIEVRAAGGKQLGYVPEHRAKTLAPLLDRGARYRAHLISVCVGAHAPVLIVQAFLYQGNAALGSRHSGTRRIGSRPLSGRAWTVVRVAIAALIAAAVAIVLRA